MLAKLVLSLKSGSDKKISMSMSSAFQGVLMEVVGSKTGGMAARKSDKSL